MLAMAAPVWVALLRGINVGAHHRVTMAVLKAAVTSVGATEVITHIQSGNLLLGHATADRAALATTLEEALAEACGFPVPVILRTGEELADLVARCPYTGSDWDEDRRRYVAFLPSAPPPELLQRLREADHGGSSLYATPTEVCTSLVPAAKPGYTDVDRFLQVRSTARAWNVVVRLTELATR
ncbi:DUF1697 domain-containing protein [Acidothermaceae bacterium B102]|nr:DUF1697 domain-containing protein [Acidothermaceae bacterium B102]